MNELNKYRDRIAQLCQQHRVVRLYAFGSVLTDRFTTESDIDFTVDFDDPVIEHYTDNYFDLKFSLEELLHRPVDLLEEKAIKNPYFRKEIEAQRHLVYGY